MKEIIQPFASYFDGFLHREIFPYIQQKTTSLLSEPMIYSLGSKGKRIRPALVMLCAGFNLPNQEKTKDPKKTKSILYAAAAIESMHTYSLIHDDLPCMDNDSMRRGKPSCHIQYSENQAVLAGDALNTLSFSLLAKAVNFNGSLDLGKLTEILARTGGMEGMVGGQILDLQSQSSIPLPQKGNKEKKNSVEQLERIHSLKTASLFSCCTEIGALLASRNPSSIQVYREYGEKLGLLFQIQDDLMDFENDSSKEEQNNYPALLGKKESLHRCHLLQEELFELAEQLRQNKECSEDLCKILQKLPLWLLEALP